MNRPSLIAACKSLQARINADSVSIYDSRFWHRIRAFSLCECALTTLGVCEHDRQIDILIMRATREIERAK